MFDELEYHVTDRTLKDVASQPSKIEGVRSTDGYFFLGEDGFPYLIEEYIQDGSTNNVLIMRERLNPKTFEPLGARRTFRLELFREHLQDRVIEVKGHWIA